MRPNIVTYTGKVFNFNDRLLDSICIEDIAHALSQICRYTGHTKEFYSVAEHSYRMSIEDLPGDPLSRLMHDSAEAYIGDISTPLKQLLYYNPDELAANRADWEGINYHISKLEHSIINKIQKALKISIDVKSTKEADVRMTATEVRDLMLSNTINVFNEYLRGSVPLAKSIIPFSPKEIEKLFLSRYYELSIL